MRHRSLMSLHLGMMRLILFGISSILTLSACQTLDRTNTKGNQEEILAAHHAIVINYLNQGMPARALKELKPLLQKYPENSGLLNLMGLTHMALGNPQRATEPLNKAYTIDPSPTTGLNLSSCYIETGRYGKAISLLKRITDDHDQMNAYTYPERINHNLGLAYEHLGKLKKAEEYYLAALKSSPAFYLSLMQLGGIYERTNSGRKARHYFARAWKTCEVCFEPVNSLAISLLHDGKSAQAARVLKKYVAQKDLDAASQQKARKLLAMTGKSASTNTKQKLKSTARK